MNHNTIQVKCPKCQEICGYYEVGGGAVSGELDFKCSPFVEGCGTEFTITIEGVEDDIDYE